MRGGQPRGLGPTPGDIRVPGNMKFLAAASSMIQQEQKLVARLSKLFSKYSVGGVSSGRSTIFHERTRPDNPGQTQAILSCRCVTPRLNHICLWRQSLENQVELPGVTVNGIKSLSSFLSERKSPPINGFILDCKMKMAGCQWNKYI